MTIRRLLALALAFATLACRPPQPCGDGCDDDAAEDLSEDPDLPPPTDLPCGGADLMTDDLNCGSCGNECYIQDLPGTGHQWDAGGSCNEGKCGSVWHGCDGDTYETCRSILEAQGLECGTGCNAKTPGSTVLYFDLFETLGGTCWLAGSLIEYSLGCDDPLPWNPDHVAEGVACCAAQ